MYFLTYESHNDFCWTRGRFFAFGSNNTSQQQIEQIFNDLADCDVDHILLYFHGGLVNEAQGIAAAKSISEKLDSRILPIFFIWKTGVLETVREEFIRSFELPAFRKMRNEVLSWILKFGTRATSGAKGANSSDHSQQVFQHNLGKEFTEEDLFLQENALELDFSKALLDQETLSKQIYV